MIVCKAEQPANALPIPPVTFPSVTVDRRVQFWNAFVPIVLKLVIELKEEIAVPANANPSIVDTFPSKTILRIPLAMLYCPAGTVVIHEGITAIGKVVHEANTSL